LEKKRKDEKVSNRRKRGGVERWRETRG